MEITIIDPATCQHDWQQDDESRDKELALYKHPAIAKWYLDHRFVFVQCRVCGCKRRANVNDVIESAGSKVRTEWTIFRTYDV